MDVVCRKKKILTNESYCLVKNVAAWEFWGSRHSLASDWTSTTRHQRVTEQIRKCWHSDFQSLSLSILKMGLRFSNVITHGEKTQWFWPCLLLCCFCPFPLSSQGLCSRAPRCSLCTAAQNVVHDLILKLGLTHMFGASWRGLLSFC